MKKNLVMRAIQEIYPNFYGGYIDLTPEFNWSNISLQSGDINEIDKALVESKIEELKSKEIMRFLRGERDRLLALTDWMANSDVTMSDSWRDYRQALRDLPANSTPSLDENGQLTGVTWPEKPE